MDQNEIRRSATLLMKAYGKDAANQAGKKADAMLARGDVNGAAYWKRRRCQTKSA